MKNKKNKAFTLVELIVVITILSILGTIGFISLQGYSSEARDSKRISDINNINKKISLEVTKGTPISELVTVTNTGIVTINSQSGTRNQGVVNFTKLKENRDDFTDNGIDYPISYSIGGTGTGRYNFLQLATIKESTNQAVLAGNYYKIQSGDSESIILNGSGQIVTDNGNILPYNILNNTLASTPTNLSRYPGCDTDDITVGSYTIAACNVGSTTASTDWTVSRGNYFQWGRNKSFSNTDKILDTISTPVSASYGLRLLDKDYTGYAIRVRRSSDNAENDIGFNSEGFLNTAALLSFVGSGNGFVTTWYDQSGNSRNAIQTNFLNQPNIVYSGSINQLNGFPTVNFGGSQWIPTTLILSKTTYPNAFVNAVYKSTSNQGTHALWGGDGSGWTRFQLLNFALSPSISWGLSNGGGVFQYTGLLSNTNTNIYSMQSSVGITNGTSVYVNGTQGSTFTETNNLSSTYNAITIGSISSNGTYPMIGNISEFIITTSILPSIDRQLLEVNQSSYYNINLSYGLSPISGIFGLNSNTDNYGFIFNSSLTNGDWSNTDITNNWGNTTNTSVARQGPCAPGYHVPSQAEWAGIVSSGGWGSNGTAMQSALKLPYAGNRLWYSGTWGSGGSGGYYWSSTPNGANGYGLNFDSSLINPSNNGSRAFGFSVRCFKN